MHHRRQRPGRMHHSYQTHQPLGLCPYLQLPLLLVPVKMLVKEEVEVEVEEGGLEEGDEVLEMKKGKQELLGHSSACFL